MKMKYLGLILFLAILVSCKKEELPVPESNEPVFTIEGTIGNEAVSLVAGDNNAYMFTGTFNENGVDVFSGNLSDGTTSIEIGFYDGKLDLPSVNAEEFAFNSLKFSRNMHDTIAVLSKSIFKNYQNIESVSWYINNSLAGYNEVALTEPGNYEVCAMISFFDGSQKSYCNNVIVGYDLIANARLKHSVNQYGQIMAWVQYLESDIEKVKWFLDEVLIAETENKEPLNYPVDSLLHVLRAEIKFVNGAERTKSVIVDGAKHFRDVEDLTNYEMGSYLQEYRDFNVRLNITKNGVQYSSEECDNTTSTMKINSVDYYGKNQNGKSVFKLNADVDANVKNMVTGTIDAVHLNINFGVEIP